MNCMQKRCLWVGIILFILANTYAPWNHLKPTPDGLGVRVTVPAGRYCIFDTPGTDDARFGLEVDFGRVVIQSAVIAAFTFGLMASFCKRKEDA